MTDSLSWRSSAILQNTQSPIGPRRLSPICYGCVHRVRKDQNGKELKYPELRLIGVSEHAVNAHDRRNTLHGKSECKTRTHRISQLAVQWRWYCAIDYLGSEWPCRTTAVGRTPSPARPECLPMTSRPATIKGTERSELSTTTVARLSGRHSFR
jgi:hypothetical protein